MEKHSSHYSKHLMCAQNLESTAGERKSRDQFTQAVAVYIKQAPSRAINSSAYATDSMTWKSRISPCGGNQRHGRDKIHEKNELSSRAEHQGYFAPHRGNNGVGVPHPVHEPVVVPSRKRTEWQEESRGDATGGARAVGVRRSADSAAELRPHLEPASALPVPLHHGSALDALNAAAHKHVGC
jgi:hypothetical protein